MAEVSIRRAGEAGLDDLVRIQFAAIGSFGPETLVSGVENPANISIMSKRHAEHVRANPGLFIAAAHLPAGPVAGFCMFYFPDRDATSDLEKIPTPLRPFNKDPEWARISVQAPWIEDPERRRKAEAVLRFIHEEKQKHVQGKECVYLRYMCVDPAFQRRGVGQALMTWACERLDSLKLDAYLEASTAGEGLYRKFGFEVIGHTEGVFEDGLRMEYSHMWRKHST